MLTLKRVAGFWFYVLGISLFTAYLLHLNEIMRPWSTWWLSVVDLPLALAALVYAGLGFALSITKDDEPSLLSVILISLPLLIVFLIVIVLNFWDVFELTSFLGLRQTT